MEKKYELTPNLKLLARRIINARQLYNEASNRKWYQKKPICRNFYLYQNTLQGLKPNFGLRLRVSFQKQE